MRIVFMAMAMLLSLAALANDKKYYSKVSAECLSGEGKVYVSTSEAPPAEADFKDASEASVDGSADATTPITSMRCRRREKP